MFKYWNFLPQRICLAGVIFVFLISLALSESKKSSQNNKQSESIIASEHLTGSIIEENNKSNQNAYNNYMVTASCNQTACQKQSSKSGKGKDDNSDKKPSTSERICKSVTNILNNEIGKTKNKTKKGILQGGLKYTNEICGAGGTPDLNKVTEGLPEKDRLRISQKTNAALFDGVDPYLKQENLTNVSGTLPSLTGKTGKITDLKSYDPSLKSAGGEPILFTSANNVLPPLVVADSNPAA
jgi:hypothetical protein